MLIGISGFGTRFDDQESGIITLLRRAEQIGIETRYYCWNDAIDLRNFEDISLVGHSYGGTTCINLANDYPGQIEHMFLPDPVYRRWQHVPGVVTRGTLYVSGNVKNLYVWRQKQSYLRASIIRTMSPRTKFHFDRLENAKHTDMDKLPHLYTTVLKELQQCVDK